MLTHSEPFKNKQTCLVFITNMKWHFSSLGVQQELNSPTDPTDAEPEPSLEEPGCEQLWDVSVIPCLPLAPAALVSPQQIPGTSTERTPQGHVCPWWAPWSGIALLVFQRCLRGGWGASSSTPVEFELFMVHLSLLGWEPVPITWGDPGSAHTSPGAQLSNTRNLLWSIEQGAGNKQLAPFYP